MGEVEYVATHSSIVSIGKRESLTLGENQESSSASEKRAPWSLRTDRVSLRTRMLLKRLAAEVR
jgi:hypothetical protein